MDNIGGGSSAQNKSVNYSEFMDLVTDNQVKKVVIQGDTISGQLADNSGFSTVAPYDNKLIDTLLERKVEVQARREEGPSFLYQLLMNLLPLL